jgi:protease-4
MKKLLSLPIQFFRFLWKAISFGRSVAANLLFIFAIVMIFVAFSATLTKKSVPSDCALLMAPQGRIVIQKSDADPLSAFVNETMGDAAPKETLLKDIIDALDLATEDSHITSLVLDLEELEPAGITKLHEIGQALVRFKAGGKKIIAFGDNFTQDQYYLACHADEIFLNPLGGVFFSGYGVYRNYFKTALEKLKIQFHLFQVGTYKSALEPFFRDDMSPQAKEANIAWLSILWDVFKTDIAEARKLKINAIDDYIDRFAINLKQAGGNPATMALKLKLVDGLKTPLQYRRYLESRMGKNDTNTDYRHITFTDYLQMVQFQKSFDSSDQSAIGIIVGSGPILDGKQPAGKIGAQSMAALFRQARKNDAIKAIVLHLDTGGGSVFASEAIRNEIVQTRKAGKPVIVSMNSVAASGGYWIASAANEIWALPTTITGSIGIFAAFPTFEKSLESLGIYNDGIGTTPLSDAFSFFRPINPQLNDVLHQLIQQGYQKFINLIAEGRNMDAQTVEKLAQGRVYAGKRALELGLVDHLGLLPEAIEAAGAAAGLTTYETIYIERPLTAKEKFFRELTQRISTLMDGYLFRKNTLIYSISYSFARDINVLLAANDPQGLYALCPTCNLP